MSKIKWPTNAGESSARTKAVIKDGRAKKKEGTDSAFVKWMKSQGEENESE